MKYKFYKLLATHPLVLGYFLPVFAWIMVLSVRTFILLCVTVMWAHYVGYVQGLWIKGFGKDEQKP